MVIDVYGEKDHGRSSARGPEDLATRQKVARSGTLSVPRHISISIYMHTKEQLIYLNIDTPLLTKQ
jgi:hypothetical protein